MTTPPPARDGDGGTGRADVDGGDAGGDGGLPRWWRSQPLGLWWGLPVGLTFAVWLLLEGEVRVFGYVVAATLAAVAALRLVLPRDSVGGLMVRSRLWDVVTLLVLAGGIAVLAATLNLPD